MFFLLSGLGGNRTRASAMRMRCITTVLQAQNHTLEVYTYHFFVGTGFGCIPNSSCNLWVHFFNNKNVVGKEKNRKEVIHPLLPERVPCYDLAPIAELTLPR